MRTAGIPLEKAAGTQTGVYVGCFTADYNDITVKDLDIPSKYAATGTVASMLSNRVSWFFDFQGPSVTVDTACSSSLVAVHEACMSLKLREIGMVRTLLVMNRKRKSRFSRRGSVGREKVSSFRSCCKAGCAGIYLLLGVIID
jgi:acyl transferase domain-containing protein